MAFSGTRVRSLRLPEFPGAVLPGRDLTWGRRLFHAPALTNARFVFDPQPFRQMPGYAVPAPRRSDRR